MLPPIHELKSLVLILVVFTCIFSIFGKEHFSGLDDEKNIIERIFNRLYFTMTTMSTVGYGDVYPKTMICRSLTLVLMIIVCLSLVTDVIKPKEIIS